LWAFGTWTKSIKIITIGTKINTITAWTFYSETKLTNVYIPDSVVRIEADAFESNPNLTELIIPSSVNEIQSPNFMNSVSKSLIFKGKTLEEVQAMENYPWGITDTSIIKVA
jgi:hypothetical protein